LWLHTKITEIEGISPETNEYYKTLNFRIKSEYPELFENDQEEALTKERALDGDKKLPKENQFSEVVSEKETPQKIEPSEINLKDTDAPSVSPKVVDFDISDLKKVSKKRQETWSKYQQEMNNAFNETSAFAQSEMDKELVTTAWERFLNAFSSDNPFSEEDGQLRFKAHQALNE